MAGGSGECPNERSREKYRLGGNSISSSHSFRNNEILLTVLLVLEMFGCREFPTSSRLTGQQLSTNI